jgi:hypothetical protein
VFEFFSAGITAFKVDSFFEVKKSVGSLANEIKSWPTSFSKLLMVTETSNVSSEEKAKFVVKSNTEKIKNFMICDPYSIIVIEAHHDRM